MLGIGARLGSYEVAARLGAGGMGEVYRARDTRLGRDVAIKVLPEGMALDAERNARFEREAKLLAALNHANIAQLYGLESADGAQFLIMELVEGDTLAERIARGPLVAEEAFRIAHQIAEGLEAAHEKGIVHRDLKPANIKRTPDGKVKVLDFGLARALEGSAPAADTLSPTLSVLATNAGLILGTAGYMSPEQARGHAADQRSDVFSFGCILFEMLTGRQTFPGDTITDVIASVVARDPDWRALPPTLHPRAQALIRRCLEKDRKQRWHSIGDVRVELESILADPHGSAALGGHAAPSAPRNRIGALLAAALLGAVIASTATYFATRPVRESKPVVRFPIILPANQRLQPAPRNILALSPDGRRLVYTTGQGLYLRNLDDLQVRPLDGTAQAAAPFFSPDGRWVGFLARDQNKLKKVAITGGAPIDIGEATALEFRGPVWNPDNYIYWGRIGSVRRIWADGGKAEDIVRLSEGEMAHRPQLLPDGWLLFTLTTSFGREGWDTGQIVIESMGSRERHVVVRGGTDGRYVPTGHLLYARGPDLLAAPFDLRTKQAGTAVPILGNVRRAVNTSAGGADAQAAVANDGSLVYVSGNDVAIDELVLTLVDPAGQQRPLNVPPGAHNSPGFSPSGGRFTFSTNDGREQSIWVGDLTGRDRPRKLTNDGQSSRPLWTPSGDRILFSSVMRENSTIYSQPVAGGPAERVFELPADIVAQLEGWLADRQTLVYTARQPGAAGSKGIFMLPPGGKPQLLVAPPASNASVSPDGKWIAYAKSATPGRPEVFIEPLPPNGDIRQITFMGAGNPLWSGDGRRLFMVGVEARQILVVDIENGLPKGEIRALPIQGIATPGPRPFDVSADGKSFLVMLPKRAETTEAAASDRIEVTLNWFEELKARVRAD